MPYQDIAQSGAMTLALCYNIPIIASNLDTFKEFMTDGANGYFFEQANAQALANRMEYVIENHNTIYNNLRANQRKMVEEKLNNSAILAKYKEYLDKLCQN